MPFLYLYRRVEAVVDALDGPLEGRGPGAECLRSHIGVPVGRLRKGKGSQDLFPAQVTFAKDGSGRGPLRRIWIGQFLEHHRDRGFLLQSGSRQVVLNAIAKIAVVVKLNHRGFDAWWFVAMVVEDVGKRSCARTWAIEQQRGKNRPILLREAFVLKIQGADEADALVVVEKGEPHFIESENVVVCQQFQVDSPPPGCHLRVGWRSPDAAQRVPRRQTHCKCQRRVCGESRLSRPAIPRPCAPAAR